MHLKTLTVRGFKSFASATTFEFEPGVTCVVGPNGSGKSNVVDALTWVMGEQGAKTLRGGKMEDVIFAGTSGRQALGRAHVSLTIDNTDGALPIEYTEVTISRTLFRTGGSEYAINGRSCRLLDIQELLSDSGLGREMHVVVGQGQLDRILHATPEERRGFIEEAAGILKHRRRKERTVRKLEGMQVNLDRLEDLLSEIRRQLTPLGRQARVARRAQRIQYDVRDARARLLADDLVQAQSALAIDVETERRLREEKETAEKQLADGRNRQDGLESRAAQATPAVTAARETWYELTAVRERHRSLRQVAAERRRLLGTSQETPSSDRDPDRLAEQAKRTRDEERAMLERVEAAVEALAEAIQDREDTETEAREAEGAVTAILRAAADRREGMAKLSGGVGAARSRVEAAENELQRLRETVGQASARRQSAAGEVEQLRVAAEDATEAAERARADRDEAVEAFDSARDLARQADAARAEALRAHDAQAARAETLRASVRQPDGSNAVRRQAADDVVGAVASLVAVRTGWERAIAAALGPLAEALAVRSHTAAAGAFEALRESGSGRVHVLITEDRRQPPGGGSGPSAMVLPAEVRRLAGVLPAGEAVSAGADESGVAEEILAQVRAELSATVLVQDAAKAVRLVAEHPAVRAVTRNGDVFAPRSAWGGAAEAAGAMEILARAEEAETKLAELARTLGKATEAAERAHAERDRLRPTMEATRAALQSAEKTAQQAQASLSRTEAVLGSAQAESDRFDRQVSQAQDQVAAHQRSLTDALSRLEAAQETADDDDADQRHLEAVARRDAAQEAAAKARGTETEARLSLRSLEEQARALGNRAHSQERAAAAERRAREEAEKRAERRRLQARNAEAVVAAVGQILERIDASVDLAEAERARAEEVRAQIDAELREVRAANESLAERVQELTDSVHRDELARAQQRMRIEALEGKSLEDLGLTPDALVENYGPHLLVPDAGVVLEAAQRRDERAAAVAARRELEAEHDAPRAGEQDPEERSARERAAADAEIADEDPGAEDRAVDASPEGDDVPGRPYVRAEQEKRLAAAEKDLTKLGRVNPLALEEFAALEERHSFLAEQLEDLKKSRADLRQIIKDVDEHVEKVFTEAWHDVEREFTDVFATLFPGGEGRLRLTDPTDYLTTGIDVEARPAGKKIKRLSLLSGGERSLTAIAMLVSIFKARPSPFYVLDEVEAALDDRNLGRLLKIIQQLQESSQLIVITHQKRTMEIADTVYGVTMRDGITTVLGQRLKELR
ncbi:chromosome segregation protein SMC [Kocuria coralli]|uniref:Chromosome partition protein Smc n=1 Tax=Kocuria coralli TaxID=1461025 RepID=A0A5J5L3P4_9MICC|nr:AAA family ATPase [Kocuria coralli]KAA9395716.1 chromosome segregation protein SMC [Kocuria coralli]